MIPRRTARGGRKRVGKAHLKPPPSPEVAPVPRAGSDYVVPRRSGWRLALAKAAHIEIERLTVLVEILGHQFLKFEFALNGAKFRIELCLPGRETLFES